MIENLLLKRLTKKGVICYFVGVVLGFALLAYYIFGLKNYSLDDGQEIFIIGMVIVNVFWAGVSYLCWKKPKEENEIITKE
ncbi:hypothetical protein [Mesonia aestuariivivens]|uniref:ABC transporter permease n=1 Tax=Mesonia aestuariivivens TaxID=2796128 RepID=A0ABS6W0J1_9FLAO|nr:hypothetical protein [Mesonia aestuariivivens]MBW2961356.1 hypothetical protein [Mesonia aestuariivivens]